MSSVDTGTVIGALAYNSGHLYGGDYTGNGNVYDINPSDGSKSVLFPFTDPGSCLFGGSYIDGLEYRPTAGNLALSGDACDTVFIKKLDGTDVSQFSTDNNSGISTDGAGGLWLARLDTSTDSTRLTHVPDPSTGTVSGDDIIISNYEAEDVAYDSVTFAPTCVLWMNEATFGTPEIKAVAVPCGAPSSGQSAAVQTTNTKFVSLFFTCGPPSNLTDDKPTFPLANGLRPDASGEVVAAYTDKLFCNDGTDTPKIISEASNGWTSTGLNDAQAVQTVNSATPKTPIVNIASPLNGSKYRRGEFIHYEGSATDGEQESIVTGLQWYFDGTPISPEGTGTQSLDKKLAANTPLGNHTITLKATDNQTNVGSTSVTISIGPALCPSTSKCP
ncbi:MAG: hypothetical protein AUH17_06290 [Actinobacteria bacterium 13_2_20CM_68_14]|nr:MAG: hypothetical protein AUH17_06290 [Actinobacteria bacterium 13_2_20CM_68_14]